MEPRPGDTARPEKPGWLRSRRTGAVALILLVVIGLLFLPFSPVRITEREKRVASSRAQRSFDALRRLTESSKRPAVVRIAGDFPEAVRGQIPVDGASPVARARGFLASYADLYGLIDGSDLHVSRIGGPPTYGVTFTQSYKSLPVFGASLRVATAPGMVTAADGRLLTRPLADVVPAIAVSTAEVSAREAAGKPQAQVIGSSVLAVFDPSVLSTGPPGPRLAWRVTVGGSPVTQVLVDAHNGAVLFVDARAAEDAGTQSFDLEVVDAEGDANAAEDDCYWTSDDVTAAEEDGVDSDYGYDPDVLEAFRGATDAYRLYHDHGRHGYDDDETQMEIFVHAKVTAGKPPNAYWVDCTGDELMEVNEDFLDDETVVHEWGHAVIGSSSNLNCCNQTGALNESYSDMMAVFASGGWVLSENMLDGGPPLRNIADPTDPAMRNGGADKVSAMAAACPGSGDNGQRHCKAGVSNKAHYLMSTGDSFNGVSVGGNGIGRDTTEDLAYWTMTNLPSGAVFANARNGEIAIAELFRDYWLGVGPFPRNPITDPIIPKGFTDDTVCRIMRAWAAVEVGASDNDCDAVDDGADDGDNDGVMDAADNCPGVKWAGFSDADGDDIGDFCDEDADGDGVKEVVAGQFGDNCPLVANSDQTDADFDGKGAACDPDEDGDIDDDGVADADDNCSLDSNTNQKDTDHDGDGDACDPDQDGDGKSNDNDNCPFTPNANQKDADGDGLGDACDKCAADADQSVGFTTGIPELGVDPQPFVPDADGDGIPDACDDDRYGLGGPLKVNGKKPGRYVLGSPGGSPRLVESQGRGGGEIEAPLDVCRTECPDGFDDKLRLVVECVDLPTDVRLWVSNDEGSPVGKPQPGSHGGAQARFHPERGKAYFVHFLFHPRYDAKVPLRTTCQFTQQQARTTLVPDPGAPTTSSSSTSTSSIAGVTTVPTTGAPTATTTTPATTTTTPATTTTTQPQDFSLSCSPSTVAAGPGGTDTSECTLRSLRGYAGRVTMSCADLANNDACAFNPQTVSLAGGGTKMTTLTITAGRSAGSYPFRVVGQGDPGPSHAFAMTFNVS